VCVLAASAVAAAAPAVDDLLAKMPAQSAEESQQINAQLAKMGPKVIAKIAASLAPPGAGDDAAARFALNGLAKYVSAPGREAERKVAAEALVTALAKSEDKEIKAFLIRQLQVAGKDEAVTALAEHLADERLCEPAAQALTAIATPAAANALAGALPGAVAGNRATILQALGNLRSEAVADALKQEAVSEDAEVQWAALYALANLAAPGTADVLAKAAATASPYDAARAGAYYSLLLRRMTEQGREGEAERLGRTLLAESAGKAHAQCAALSALVDALGKNALDDLLAAMDSDDRGVRACALELAAVIPGKGATKQWGEKMAQASPEARLEIMAMLGQRGDETALPALLDALGDADQSTRLMAINAAMRLGGIKAVPKVLEALQTAEDSGEIKTAKAALLRVGGNQVTAQAAKALPAVTPAARKALVELLAARRAVAQKEAVFACAKDVDQAVQVAATKALVNLTTADDLPRLVDLLLAAQSDRAVSAAVDTVIAVAAQLEDKEQRDDLLVAALDQAPTEKHGRLFEAMAGHGGAEAIEAVVEGTRNSEDTAKDAAIRALADWPDAAAATPLMNLASREPDLKRHVIALRGYIRIVGASGVSADEKVAMYGAALEAAKRSDEKRQAISGLADVRTLPALQVVGWFLDDEALKAEAALAVVKIACPQNENDKGLREVAAAAALQQALGSIGDEEVRKKAEAHLATLPLPDAEGFVPLFNGKDLTGWTGDTKGYVVEDGVIVCKPGGNLYTEKEFGDFIFRFEFKLTPGANNGLAVRGPIGGGAYNGMELQILDNTADKYKDLQPYQYHGSIYGVVPAERGHQKPVGEWNAQEVTAKGRQITVILNGATIVDADLDEASTPETMDHKEHKGLDRTQGHLGFLGHGDLLWFRNIRIKELP